MKINLVPFLVLWIVFALAVLVLIAWRQVVSRQDDETLHVLDEDAGEVTHQVDVSHKLDQIDKWGKILTLITVIYGLVLGAFYLYRTWVEMSRIGV